MRRVGFTLIELLVVIAIIAILAALLFPVFAQAKVSGKGAASLSNIKQHIAAWHMYASDYDDMAVPLATQTPGPLTLDGKEYSPWSQLLQAYTHNPEVTQDPVVPPNQVENGIPVKTLWPYRPQYGYAFTVWSPLTTITVDGKPKPVTLTSAASSGETVVFTSRKDRNTLDWQFVGTVVWMSPAVAPPYCGGGISALAQTNVNPQSYCAINHRWGVNGDGGIVPAPTDAEGRRTGSVAIRKAGMALVAFADGHAKYTPPGNLARGTNWHWDILPSQIQLTNKSLYMWDLD